MENYINHLSTDKQNNGENISYFYLSYKNSHISAEDQNNPHYIYNKYLYTDLYIPTQYSYTTAYTYNIIDSLYNFYEESKKVLQTQDFDKEEINRLVDIKDKVKEVSVLFPDANNKYYENSYYTYVINKFNENRINE